ncbi:arabinan endo-1,5-alpha-L-arabinosidase [Parafrankia elaeagni]|uniref:arabinan endo-1,5-alpha-L-arabinosidase n=1 Tax=Parafrankia elaeagni TaxID=222534 RepID=UPI00037DBDD2|nr:arabinan endo-1,5-alpha-L-arabinosidase [Parafrankia elaeagni]
MAVTVMVVVCAAVVPASPARAAYPGPGYVTGNVTVHDPSMVRTSSGYLLYSTHNGIEIRSSADRVNFSYLGRAFPTIPSWVYSYNSSGDLWAPDVSYQNGQYWLYYSASSFGSNRSAIGLATSTTGLPGSWTDRGIVISSTTSSTFNAIDPALLVDNDGRWWLSFGSFWSGIYMIRIDPSSGRQLATDTTRYHLAHRPPAPHAVEAPYIVYRSGYYYLFVSHDLCCRGTSSTYRIMVGRSASPNGPYLDRSGVPLTSGGGTEIVATHDAVVGPGGQSVLRDVDGSLLVYHYYDAGAGGRETLGVNRIGWSGGWPNVW